jgi:hypothetical protein
MSHFAWRDKDKNALITELADALKARNQLGDTQSYLQAVKDVRQRAREAATK